MPSTCPEALAVLRRAAVAAATTMALAALLAPSQAQAQSGYTLTVLKGPNTKPVAPKVIDAQNRVLGTAEYLTGFGLKPDFSGYGLIYTPYAVRWPASTAGSVSGTKLTPHQQGPLTAASSDGSKAIIFGVMVQDLVTNQSLGFIHTAIDSTTGEPLSNTNWLGVSNGGMAVGLYNRSSYDPDRQRVVTWSPPDTAQALPFDGYQGARPTGTNGQGDVSGAVLEAGLYPLMRAAVWVQGALQVLDQQPGRGSAALSINANGQVLMRTRPASRMDGVDGYRYGSPIHYLVHSHGAEQAITALKAGEVAVPSSMNASGTVVGRMGAVGVASPYGPRTPLDLERIDAPVGRAFIWRNGVTTDLTTLVTSKGVKLPAGSVLSDALGINDQGSILAQMRDSRGGLSFVRLTAKP